MVKLKCLDEKCGKMFLLPAKILIERKPADFTVIRIVVEKPSCPFCESLAFEEVTS